MPINLFLDTNIFLSFYALSDADITQLKKLKNTLAGNDIKLFLSGKVAKEIERNRDVKIKESFKALKDGNFRCSAPSFVKNAKEFLELQELIKNISKKHAELIKSTSKLIENKELEADKIISDIISVSGIIEITQDQFDRAYKRYLVGDPPGKKKATIGDELNWEFLMEVIPDGQDVHLVSSDIDYASAHDQTKINTFLYKEWKDKKNSELHFYRDLNDFFALHIPNITLANQAKLSELIAELATSGSFSSTHAIVSKFPGDPDFSEAQVIDLINIKKNNSQVGWIADDADVQLFYGPVEKRYAEIQASAQGE
ncbi:PIN domain-containing protein [Xanthobacter oligotrophicus]|uniref:PIN domain-containing protein n=1 Tax=Xanthobacter oligotrophicus TaxID=2607286 RepID=A0ABW6ZZY9_9HYPH